MKLFVLVGCVTAGLLWFVLSRDRAPGPAEASSGVSAGVSAAQPPVSTAPQGQPVAVAENQLAQFSEQLLTPPYSQAVHAGNLAQTQDPLVSAVTIPLDDGIVWTLQPKQFRFSYPEPIEATVRVSGEQPALLRYQLRRPGSGEILVSGDVEAGQDGLYRLNISGQEDFPDELELTVDSEPGHGALAQLQYVQPVAWLEQAGRLQVDDTDLLIPLQLEIKQAGLYRVQAVLGVRQTPAKPLAILQGEFSLAAGTADIVLRAHHSVLPAQAFVAELSRLQLELAPPVPGAKTGYGRALSAPIALGDVEPAALNKRPYQPDAQAMQRVELLQQLSQ
jgi:hypothetical protein